MDFEFLKYQGDQLFRIVLSVFLEITAAALRICTGLGPHEVPSSGCRRGYSNSTVMRLVTFRIIFLYFEPFAKPLYKFAPVHIVCKFETLFLDQCSSGNTSYLHFPFTVSLILNRTKHLLVYKIRKTD